MDEPMHRWYDPKHGMFDVLEEADCRRRYAPKACEGEVLSAEEAIELVGADAAAQLPGLDLRTREEMLAAGVDIRLDVDAGEFAGSGREVIDEADFATWLLLADLDLAPHLYAFWREMDIGAEGEALESLKESDADAPVAFFLSLIHI